MAFDSKYAAEVTTMMIHSIIASAQKPSKLDQAKAFPSCCATPWLHVAELENASGFQDTNELGVPAHLDSLTTRTPQIVMIVHSLGKLRTS
jgi:hypothetical protein